MTLTREFREVGLWSRKVRARKRLGQHFLQPAWADRLVDAIGPHPVDRFLEIGPGPGALTLRLAERAGSVTAVEVDPALVAALRPRLPPNVTLVEGDFLELPIDELLPTGPPWPGASDDAARFRVAGNLPYNISSPILFRLLDAHVHYRNLLDATLMLQREVADRLQAEPGTKDYGLLSIFVQLHADVDRVLALPPGAFRPVPKVHSTVLRLTFRPPAAEISDAALFEEMVRSMFTQRRKTLSNALRRFAAARGIDSQDALRLARIDPTRRPETLQLDELARLAEFFASA